VSAKGGRPLPPEATAGAERMTAAWEGLHQGPNDGAEAKFLDQNTDLVVGPVPSLGDATGTVGFARVEAASPSTASTPPASPRSASTCESRREGRTPSAYRLQPSARRRLRCVDHAIVTADSRSRIAGGGGGVAAGPPGVR
jgi:hypothetical protein